MIRGLLACGLTLVEIRALLPCATADGGVRRCDEVLASFVRRGRSSLTVDPLDGGRRGARLDDHVRRHQHPVVHGVGTVANLPEHQPDQLDADLVEVLPDRRQRR